MLNQKTNGHQVKYGQVCHQKCPSITVLLVCPAKEGLTNFWWRSKASHLPPIMHVMASVQQPSSKISMLEFVYCLSFFFFLRWRFLRSLAPRASQSSPDSVLPSSKSLGSKQAFFKNLKLGSSKSSKLSDCQPSDPEPKVDFTLGRLLDFQHFRKVHADLNLTKKEVGNDRRKRPNYDNKKRKFFAKGRPPMTHGLLVKKLVCLLQVSRDHVV